MVINERVCTKCGILQPLTEFYKDSTRKSGRRGHCRSCTLKAHQAYCAKPENKARIKASVVRYAESHVDMIRLVNNVSKTIQNAIKRGEVTRPSTCSECGNGGRIEAAHSDYSKRYEVRWLCVSCHRRWDRATPKLSEAV